ncbi:MAG: AraC family transcriptional regulator, partial [Bacteroidia bacterium]|nr:AraC family transcriptional regulator [Bacteroidia bacterium]
IHDHGRIKELSDVDFELLGLNQEAPKMYDGTSPHRHTFFELFIFRSAGTFHEIDFKKFPVNQYSIHFVAPLQVHKLQHGKAKGLLFCFNESLFRRADKKSTGEVFPFYAINADKPFIDLSKKDFDEMMVLVNLVVKEYDSVSEARFEVISSLMNVFLNKLKEKYAEERPQVARKTSGKNPAVLDFLQKIERDYLLHAAVSDYAEQLNLSPNYLNALCKKELGTTAVSLIQERMALEAKRMLYSTTLSVKEISLQLNFEDTSYFNRFFKKLTGQTPLYFRQSAGK